MIGHQVQELFARKLAVLVTVVQQAVGFAFPSGRHGEGIGDELCRLSGFVAHRCPPDVSEA